jgi:peptide subunit release factor 1 (eRF1)
VRIQKQLTDNDGTWYGHKLRRQVDAEPKKRLTDKEVKNALLGVRQALKDIGALPENGKSKK